MSLTYTWTFSILKYDNTKNWNECLHEIGKFKTIQEIWGLLNHTTKPNNVIQSTNYSLFKNNIQPTWEDLSNINGGRILIPCNKMNICNYWETCILTLVSNTKYPQINGIVLTIRKNNYKMTIWLNTCNSNVIKSIGRELKKILNYDDSNPNNEKIKFESHLKAKTRNTGIVIPDFII